MSIAHQECWKSPVHAQLIPASNGPKTSKEEGECSMLGKGIQGRNSLVPRCQCKSCMVKARLPEPQSKDGYVQPTAKESRKAVPEEQGGFDWPNLVPASLGHPQSSGLNGRTGNLTMTQLNHTEMRDCLSWWRASVRPPVWQRSLHCTQRLPVMGLAASTRWISRGIRRGNTTESRTLRGRETVLDATNTQL
jgi:hypothetical protein